MHLQQSRSIPSQAFKTKEYDVLLFVEKTTSAVPVSAKNMQPMIISGAIKS